MPEFLENVDISGDFLNEALAGLKDPAAAAAGIKFDVPDDPDDKDDKTDKGKGEVVLTPAQKATIAAQKLENKDEIDDFVARKLENPGAREEEDDELDDKNKKPVVKKPAAAAAKPGEEELKGPWVDLHKEFIEKGLILDDEEIPFDGSYESLMQAIEVSNEVRREEDVTAYIQAAFKGNPANADTGVKLFNHLAKGGKVADFVDAYSADTVKESVLESDKEDEVRAASTDVLRKYYSLLKWDASSIDKALQTALNSGTYKQQAAAIIPEYNKLVDGRKTAVTESARVAQEKSVNERKLFNNQLVEVINKSEEIGGYPIGKKKEKKEQLIDYYFTPAVDVQGGKVSQFVADMREASKDPNWTVLLGLVYNAYKKGTGPSAATTKAGSEAVKTIRSSLEQYAQHKTGGNGEIIFDPRTAGSGESKAKKKSGLLGLFEDEN
jgi:hypothetical protein